MSGLFSHQDITVQANVLNIDTTCPTTVWYEGADGSWEPSVNIVIDNEAFYASPPIDLTLFSAVEVTIRRKRLRIFGKRWKVVAAYIGNRQLYLQRYP